MATTEVEPEAAHYSESLKPWIETLPKIRYGDTFELYQWEGFWYAPRHLEAAKAVQSHFQARPDDVILASSLKTGTIWLKALTFCIMGPKITDINLDPLLEHHPAVFVQTLETQTYIMNPNPDLFAMPSPRLFHTHLPFETLPESVKSPNSHSKIVYIVRNPKDTLVSMWHFFNTVKPAPFELLFQGFCHGVSPFGPFWDHALGYWNQSLKRPEKVLFLGYEDLKRDPVAEVKKLGEFLGRRFEDDEEVEKVIWRSSLERLKNLEVNKNGVDPWSQMPNSSFFRRGVVGDWKSCFTPEMEERVDQITREKLAGTGLDLAV